MGNRRHFVVIALAVMTMAGTTWRALDATPGAPPPEAPGSLVDTGLYLHGQVGIVDPKNRPFSPQYPLWTDGAAKRRWIYLPPGTRIDATDPQEWEFPVGTRVWKEFAFGGRPVETRFIWRATANEWVFASYAWNPAGTSATRAPDEGIAGAADIAPNRQHAIPSIDQCRACHVSNRTEVLGFNALQLSTDRDPNALHAEPLEPRMVTLRTLVEEGALAPPRPELVAAPPRIDARTPDERALLGYLAGNCGVCHNRQTELAPLGLHWKHGDVVTRGTDALLGLVAHRTKWQVPGVPAGESVAIDPRQPERSAILRRMRSRSPVSQMPPLGTVVQDRDAVALLSRWLSAVVTAHSGERRD